jgi:DNA polymerase-3 subunit alpha
LGGGALTDSFVHLHLHTEYSRLDGASRIGEVVAAAAADGQPAVGITDHGNMYGVLPLYEAAREAGIKPVLGMEGYFTNTSRFERPKRSEHEIFHLTMLAETNEGYRNLIKVTSAAYLDGYYYKPRSDWELLERHHAGITATTGCLGGLVSQLILNDEPDAALEAAAAATTSPIREAPSSIEYSVWRCRWPASRAAS